MLKFIILTIFLVSSPAFGLLERLYQGENHCYSGCNSNYAESLANIDACKKGCDYKLHNENCAAQCRRQSRSEEIQASCLVGCSMNQPVIDRINEHERPRSIILIRLRQRPSVENVNHIISLHDIIRQIQEKAQLKSNEVRTIIHLTKNLPIEIPSDASKEKSTYLQRLTHEWNNLLHRQPKLPTWILLAIFLISSAMLWYMIVSLCCHTPRQHHVSIRAQELIIDNAYQSEKDPLHDNLETIPVKVKLSDH